MPYSDDILQKQLRQTYYGLGDYVSFQGAKQTESETTILYLQHIDLNPITCSLNKV